MERILCSAIWYQELDLKKPEVLENRGILPYNIDKGVVFCGWRHANCMYLMVAITGNKNSEVGKSIQGFLTNLNRFVDRAEGAKIALESKQIEKLNYSDKLLYSEDLW